MRPFLKQSVFAVAVLVSVPGLALAQRAGTAKVDRVQLAVVDSGGASCGRDAVVTAWAHTSGPGVVRFVIHNSGGGKTGELKANAVAGAAGTYLATYSHTFKVTADVDTQYMAEASGASEAPGDGQHSNWVPFKASCGPRARAETSAAGSSSQPPARTAESRARQSMGTPTAGGGTPPATGGTPPATPAPQSKPNSGQSGGTSKPNSAPSDGARQCGGKITSTRLGALTREGGKMTAQIGWMAAVVQEHPDSWKLWDNAQERSLGCKRAGALWTCTASARPCEP